MNLDTFGIDAKLRQCEFPFGHQMRVQSKEENETEKHAKPEPILTIRWPLGKQDRGPNHHPNTTNGRRNRPARNPLDKNVFRVKRLKLANLLSRDQTVCIIDFDRARFFLRWLDFIHGCLQRFE